MREKLLAQEAKQHDPKVPFAQSNGLLLIKVCGVLKKKQCKSTSAHVQVQAQKKRHQQQELIAELRKRQAKDHRPVYEGKDGTIEDIITGGAGSRESPRGASRTSSGRSKWPMTVVVRSSALLRCTLCYVVQTSPHLENSTQRRSGRQFLFFFFH